MGLMGTLAKVAIGYAAARGVDKLSGGQGLGGLLGGGAQVKASDPNAAAQAQMLSGGQPGGEGNPLKGMLDMFQQNGLGTMGASAAANPMTGLMDQLKSMAGSTGGSGLLSQLGTGGTGMAGMLAALGGTAAAAQGKGTAGLLDALNTKQTAPEAEEAAGLMLRAMIMAAKSDGSIDESEKAKLLETVGPDADPEDMAFVQAQLAAPVDPEALAADTPEPQRMQVYSASLMTIRVDTQAEAQYLDRLAKALKIDEPTVNMLHAQMGIAPLYA